MFVLLVVGPGLESSHEYLYASFQLGSVRNISLLGVSTGLAFLVKTGVLPGFGGVRVFEEQEGGEGDHRCSTVRNTRSCGLEHGWFDVSVRPAAEQVLNRV